MGLLLNTMLANYAGGTSENRHLATLHTKGLLQMVLIQIESTSKLII